MSLARPKNPASSPSAPPATAARPSEPATMPSVIRAPYSTRAYRSRPVSSVPNGCAAEGGCSAALTCTAVGECAVSVPGSATT